MKKSVQNKTQERSTRPAECVNAVISVYFEISQRGQTGYIGVCTVKLLFSEPLILFSRIQVLNKPITLRCTVYFERFTRVSIEMTPGEYNQLFRF